MLKHSMPTFYSKIINLKIGPKFIAAICVILVVLTVLDITYNAKKEQHIAYESAENWTNLVAETVRISLNTLMREDKMDMRFKLFDSLSEELTELDDVRVIRSARTNEIFLEVNQKEIIPQLKGNKELILNEISELNVSLTQAISEDEKTSINEKIQYLKEDLELIEKDIIDAGILQPIDPREAPRDSLDRKVLKTGIPIYRFEGDSARVLIPYTADRSTCSEETGCHTYAKEGDVLGAISLEFSIAKMNEAILHDNIVMTGFWMMRFIVFLIVITFLLSFIITRHLKSMLKAFNRLSSGDLSVRAHVRSNDEIGQLAVGFNNMAETLDKTTVSKDYVDNIIRNMMDILVIISPSGKILRLNSPTCELLGFTEIELIGQPIETIFTIHKSASDLLFETGSIGNLEGTFFSKDNKVVPVIYSASLMYGSSGEIDGIICVAKDITEKKESIEKLQQLTQYDGLTGLLNRTRIIEILNKRLERSRSLDQSGALLIIDIDDFLIINDRYGHKMGDAFIKHFASLLQGSAKEFLHEQQMSNETYLSIARLGSDEFAIILPDSGDVEALKLAEMIRENVANYRNPLFSETSKETASIGIALYPEHADTASELLTRADTAMFRAKELGGNQTHIFSQVEGDHTVFHARRKWKERINGALKDARFELWYQPIIDLGTDTIGHYEALVRMRGNDGKIVMPGSFIGAAERYNLISDIDRVVSAKAIAFQAENSAQGRDLAISINLSGKDLENEEFLSFLRQQIDETGANAGYLTFEITETEAVRDLDKAKNFIQSLKSLGCKFALDDFGVGFTSFLYLKEMQVDYIKIDGCFISKLDQNHNDQVFVKAIVDVATGMGIKTVAEFVENEETLALLKQLGVSYGQGYLIGKPSPDLVD